MTTPNPSNEGSSPKKTRQPKSAELRWQRLFQNHKEPVFLLDPQRRIAFANKAFLHLTNLGWEEISGRVCRQVPGVPAGSVEALLTILTPPDEALAGKLTTIRRPAFQKSARHWDISFFPLCHDEETATILGKIVLGEPLSRTPPVPIPPRLFPLRDRVRHWHRLDHLQSDIPAMRGLWQRVRLAVQTMEPLWIRGEPGAGKRWLARLIHEEGQTSSRGFAALDCRRLPAALVAEALFGDRELLPLPWVGTICLHEPQHLPRELQVRLCDVLRTSRETTAEQDRRPRWIVTCRLSSQQEGDDPGLVQDFRQEFSVLTLEMPPLRERRADLRVLAERLCERAAVVTGKQGCAPGPDALELLHAAPWPGNVSELYGVLRQACLRTNGDVVQVDDLPWYLRSTPAPVEKVLNLDAILEQVERRLMLLALDKTGEKKGGEIRYNKSKAAHLLSIWRARLIKRLKDLGIETKDEKDDATGPGPGV